MTLAERKRAIAYALEPIQMLLSDAETCAWPGPERNGLLRARLILSKIQGWLALSDAPAGASSRGRQVTIPSLRSSAAAGGSLQTESEKSSACK